MARPPNLAGALRVAALASLAIGAPALVHAQTSAASSRTAVQTEGKPLARIDVVLVRASGNAARDQAILARLRAALSVLEGRAYRAALVETLLTGPRARLDVGQIEHFVSDAPDPVGSVVLRVEVSRCRQRQMLHASPSPRSLRRCIATSVPI